jgi:HD superfamily phosphohydrolase YqeK
MTTKENFEKALTFIKRDGVEELVNYLKSETDFFTAPASSNFHGNFEGGLLEHTVNVTQFALHNFNVIVTRKPDLEYLRESVVICALFHDVCKTNYYVKEKKWTKDADNKWKEYFGYTVKDSFPLGHGEKSVFIISKYVKLTNPEAMAIRWHMGATEPSVSVPNNAHYYAYNEAIDHPLVRLIHCADMLSMTLEEKKDLKNI